MQNKITESFANDNTTANNDKLTSKNLIMFSFGAFGRELLYCFFAFQLLNYIIFTKQLTEAQFGVISLIIVAARAFDAFNDPIIGEIIDKTNTRWGKFKPWQLIGAILTAGVVITMFSTNLQGGAFIILIAFMYFLFSITFTMNDIAYWAMMPSLTINQHERSKLMSGAQISASIGGALAGAVPLFTIGTLAIAGAVAGFRIFSIFAAICMIGFQLFTILGVKETKIPEQLKVTQNFSLKEIIRKIIKNDQLMWLTLILIIYMVGATAVITGLASAYVYFEFGYNGLYFTLFVGLYGIVFMLFPVVYPFLEKKFTRTKMVYITGSSMVIGFTIALILGFAIPTSPEFSTLWYVKFASMSVALGVAGFGQGFVMLMIICLTNTVEYNEYRTGERDEGLIFSCRSFTMKLATSLVQGVVTIVYIIAGVLQYTNIISVLENESALGHITEEAKLQQINVAIESVSKISINILLVSLCLIPIICLSICMLIYKKKYILDEKTFANIVKELETRKAQKTL